MENSNHTINLEDFIKNYHPIFFVKLGEMFVQIQPSGIEAAMSLGIDIYLTNKIFKIEEIKITEG